MLGPKSFRNCTAHFSRSAAVAFCCLLIASNFARAQEQKDDAPGYSIGKVSTNGNLIVVELNDGALGKPNLFNLNGRTLRFTPDNSRYRVKNVTLQWDPDFGTELSGSAVVLHRLTFPFSGKRWNAFRVGTTGSLRFGGAAHDEVDPYGHPDGGVGPSIGRFDQLSDAAGKLVASAPAICVFLKPRMYGPRYVKELPDRVVITWDLTEPFGGLLDFTWFRTINQFQAVLRQNGVIEMSYKEMNARDGIVGIYPLPSRSSGSATRSVHLSSLTHENGPFAVVYESFHYLAVPRPQDLSCTVLKALGDKFDFLAYYSDFRVDNQEASSPSDGPVGGKITGIGDTQHEQSPSMLASRCTQGRFQLGYLMPVFVGSNEMQEGAPDGAPVGNAQDITFYSDQLAEVSPNKNARNYNYAMAHLGHEVCHRWAAYVFAKVGGQTVRLGPWPHWSPGLQSPVAFPYSLRVEASTMGGGVWQDNLDGTYTQMRDGYFVPATGYSYLDLYLMGLASAKEVPDFFLLENLVRVGKDTNGRARFRAETIKVTIQDVIEAEGPRQPDFDHSQRKFNTGIVVMVEHGRTPSPELLERASGIRQRWLDYWDTVTAHRTTMSSSPE